MMNDECRIERRERAQEPLPPSLSSFIILHSERNVVVVERLAAAGAGSGRVRLARLAVFAVAPVEHARPLVGLVVAPLLLLALAARLLRPVGLRRALARLQAVLPLLPLDGV